MNVAVIRLNAQRMILPLIHQNEELLLKQKLLQEIGTTACPEEGVTRELCQICKGPYAYGLSPRYVSGIDDEDPNSPHLPKLEFDQPVIQFDERQPNKTIKQLAIMGASFVKKRYGNHV